MDYVKSCSEFIGQYFKLVRNQKNSFNQRKKVRYERIFVDQIWGSCVRDYVYFKY